MSETGRGSKCYLDVCKDKATSTACAKEANECTFDAETNQCRLRECRATDRSVCSALAGCMWNAAQSKCVERSKDCIYSADTIVQPCKTLCTSFKQITRREIVLDAQEGGKACDHSALETISTCGTEACTCDQLSSDSTACASTVGCSHNGNTCAESHIDACAATNTSSSTSSSCPTGCVKTSNSDCVPTLSGECTPTADRSTCGASDKCSYIDAAASASSAVPVKEFTPNPEVDKLVDNGNTCAESHIDACAATNTSS
eukprot:PhM_4_TR15894/c4_g1_i4/m.72060